MLLEPIQNLIDSLKYTMIPDDRKEVLQPLIDYINERSTKGEPIRLLFVCTHNSRRSHLAQIWAKVAAMYFDIEIESYSGGVEVTALNERVVKELEETGFEVNSNEGPNPVYLISFTDSNDTMRCFSKLYDDEFNPVEDFAAIMTCSDADENCPFIPGTQARIPIRYEDPKAFDDTSLETEKYHERSIQIANEMTYVFSKITK
jgi:arsenate reductase